MLRLVIFGAILQCCLSQQYNKVAPGVPPQNYQNFQQHPPPPPPNQQPPPQQQYQPPPPQQQQQQQYQQAPPQQQQFQQAPQQQQFQQAPQQFQQPPQHGHVDPQLLSPSNIAQERDHIQEHMDVPIDTSKMSEQELQFHYFKMHDADNNNKLDGCELIKSLIHWHEDHLDISPLHNDTHYEILVDHVLKRMDSDDNGLISWPEFRKLNGLVDLPDGDTDKNHPTYSDEELEQVLEYALKHVDLNQDGYVDFVEYRVNHFKAKLAKEKVEKENQSLDNPTAR